MIQSAPRLRRILIALLLAVFCVGSLPFATQEGSCATLALAPVRACCAKKGAAPCACCAAKSAKPGAAVQCQCGLQRRTSLFAPSAEQPPAMLPEPVFLDLPAGVSLPPGGPLARALTTPSILYSPPRVA